jgi:ABC-type lipoprotein export system ATPase subunit
LAIFKRLHKLGRTIIVVTHDSDVAEHADRIIVIKDRRIVADRAVAEPRDAEAELAAEGKDDRE